MRRKDFIKLTAYSAGGLMIAQLMPFASKASGNVLDCFQPSPLLKICNDGRVYVYVLKQEMGQGVQTSLPMILAEELEVDIKDIIIEAMPFDAAKGGSYSTGGSTSVMSQWMPMRKAGAAAREMLIAAAAKEWNTSVDNCRAERGKVINTTTNQELAYKDLITKAALIAVPANPALKNYKDFKVIGKPNQKKNNIKEIITGKLKYGIDIKLPGMLYAVIVRCPVIYGKVKSWDEASIKNIEGIVKLMEMKEMGDQLENRAGVAIVGINRWSVLKAQQKLKVEWAVDDVSVKVSSASYYALQKEKLKTTPDVVFNEKGDTIKEPVAVAANAYTATYRLPFLAHATMEPVNCIAQFKEGKFELWGGFQNPGKVANAGSKFFGLKSSDVFIHLMPMGGGFGRKLNADYGAEAMQIAKAVDKPVQLMFTRADDMKFDAYRPASTHQLSAVMGTEKKPTNWLHQIIISPPGDFYNGNKGNLAWLNGEAGGGAYGDMYYEVKPLRSSVTRTAPPVAVGWWRSVNFTYNNVVIECFIDELAQKAGVDGLTYRLSLLKNLQAGNVKGAYYDPRRMEKVLQLCADKIGWSTKKVKGRGLGIACCFYNHAKAYTAHAFEISVDKNKVIKIHRAVVATDIGIVIDPDGLRNQIEGSLVWGLSATVKSEITVENGAVQQNSFFDFEVCRMPDIPTLEIHIVESGADPGGAGETSVPSVMPALMNAIAAATGTRIRELPLKKAGYSLG